MNERIRELAEQAVNAVDNPFPGNPLNDELEKMYIPDCFAEKFAQLIVQECIGISTKIDKNPYIPDHNPLNDELEKMYIPDCFAEKFAQLIVQECIGISIPQR